MGEAGQIFVRNREGKVYGPIEPSTVELLVEGGVLQGMLQVSLNGEDYALPYRFPEIRDFFPRHLWGDGDRETHDVQLDMVSPSEDGFTTEATRQAHPGRTSPPELRAPAPVERVASPPVLSPPPPAPGAIPAATASPPVITAPAFPASAPPILAPRGTASSGHPAPAPVPASPPVLTAPSFDDSGPALFSPEGEPMLATEAHSSAPPPFELAPPGPSRPSGQVPTPLTSTFGLLRAELAEKSALRIYAEGAQANATGLFFFDLPDRTITVYMRRGNPESADSTHAEDGVGKFILAQRLASAEQVARAEREALRFGNDVLAALFTLGFVNPGLVFPALAQRAADLLVKAYLAPSGHFRFEALELPPSKLMPLGNRWGLLAEAIRRVPLPELKAKLLDVRERPVVRRGTGDALPDLRLTAQETRALGYFDGARSLANLSQSNVGEMDTILRVALLLRELDAVSFPDIPVGAQPPPPPARPVSPPIIPRAAPPPPSPATPPRAAPSPPASPPAAPPRSAAGPPSSPPPAPSSPRSPPVITPSRSSGVAPVAPQRRAPSPRSSNPAQELRDLQARLERMRKETFFQVLGVSEQADSAGVKTAYFKLAKLYHPDTVPPDAPPELAQVKEELFAAIGEAYRILGDEASRTRYHETLAQGGPGEVDVQNLFHAEETFNKGTALVRARRFGDAVKAFDNAIATNPREGEFYAWRGYARFFTLQDKKVAAADAMRDLNQALKLNERCAPAHYFIGQIYKLTGDGASALKHFKKCVSIDSQHVDAQREIRILVGK